MSQLKNEHFLFFDIQYEILPFTTDNNKKVLTQ